MLNQLVLCTIQQWALVNSSEQQSIDAPWGSSSGSVAHWHDVTVVPGARCPPRSLCAEVKADYLRDRQRSRAASMCEAPHKLIRGRTHFLHHLVLNAQVKICREEEKRSVGSFFMTPCLYMFFLCIWSLDGFIREFTELLSEILHKRSDMNCIILAILYMLTAEI